MTSAPPADIQTAMANVDGYRRYRDALKRYKQQTFKEGTLVYIDNGRKHGYGRCLPPEASRPDRVEVKMESGAQWQFEFSDVVIVDESTWPYETL